MTELVGEERGRHVPGSHRAVHLDDVPGGWQIYAYPAHAPSRYETDPDLFSFQYVDESVAGSGRHNYVELPCPPWLIAAWHAGEDVRPLLDWLVEAHGDARPWLAEAVAREFAGAGR